MKKRVKLRSKKRDGLYVRNIIFGVEDSLVSTVGVLSGIAIANVPRATILLTGVIYLFVEAFSMAVGSILSEHSVEQYQKRKETPLKFIAGLVMFFSYFIAGFIPLGPYALLPVANAFWLSILASFAALFLLGAISARFFNINPYREGWRMLLIGGIAIVLGVIVGRFMGLA